MAFVITEPCVGTCERLCVDVCPVDCIQPSKGFEDKTGKQLYINPAECIDCGACQWECPVEAIYPVKFLPEKWHHYVEINANYFKTAKK